MRKKIVAGNWKLNNNVNESIALAKEVHDLVSKEVSNKEVGIVVCPVALNVYPVAQALQGSSVKVGAQNCYSKENGAYTGELAPSMIASAGATYVIIGHSERREYFNESDQFLAEKTDAALTAGLTPLFCFGEKLEEREKGIHFDLVKNQITDGLFHLSAEQFKKVVLAYEPVWAIGTGVTASSEQAQEMHKMIRDHVASKYGQAVADQTTILYGGSCKPSNAQELFACADVDGGLIGGAALKARDFVDIIKSF